MVSSVNSILNPVQQRQLTAIRSTARLVDDVSKRLASGLKVNSAIDNPQNFFSSQALKFRAADIGRRLDGIGQSIRTLQEAQTGLDSSIDLLNLAESYLVDIEEKYMSGEISAVPQGDPTNVTNILPSPADFINYAGSQDSGGPVTVTGGGESFTLSGNLWKRLAVNYTVTPDTVLEFDFEGPIIPEIAAIGFDNDSNFGNDSNRFFLYGTQSTGITYATPTGTYQYPGTGVVHVEIPVGTFFTGTFSHLTFINDDDSGPTGTSIYSNMFLREGPIDNALVGPAGLQEGYEGILDQLDTLTEDAQYRGINLLQNDDLTTYFNEEGSSSLTTEAIDATSSGLGLEREDFNSLAAVQMKIEQVREAREALRRYSASVASDLNILKTRQDFTRQTINTLLAGGDDLVVDDQNQAGAEFLALRVRQQIQFSTLAQPQASITDFL
ncbi:MAG: hypothetical protein JKY71_11755 [Alphaproteobacteria bacterium]|nr:hypothetical protein [Alphaproteobacteria bacterium]